MNSVLALLERWEHILREGRERSALNVSKGRGGLDARMKVGAVATVTDLHTNQKMSPVQEDLAGLRPDLRPVIFLAPHLPGEWRAGDYLDLYYDHYQNTIDRIRALYGGPIC